MPTAAPRRSIMACNTDTTTDSGKSDEHDKDTPTSFPAELISLVARMLPLADVHNNVLRALIDDDADFAGFLKGYLVGNTGVLEEIADLAVSSDPTQNAIGNAWLDSWMKKNKELVEKYSATITSGDDGVVSMRPYHDSVFNPVSLFYSPMLASWMGNADLLERTLALGPLDINSQCDFGGRRPCTPLGHAIITGNRRCLEFLLSRDDIDVGAATHPGGWPAVFCALQHFLTVREESSSGLQYDLNFLESFVGHASIDLGSLVDDLGVSILHRAMVFYYDDKSVPHELGVQALCLLMEHGADGQSGVPFSPLEVALFKAKSEDPQIAARNKVVWAILSGHLFLDCRSPLWGFVLKGSILLQYLYLGSLVWPLLLCFGAFLRFLRLPLRIF